MGKVRKAETRPPSPSEVPRDLEDVEIADDPPSQATKRKKSKPKKREREREREEEDDVDVAAPDEAPPVAVARPPRKRARPAEGGDEEVDEARTAAAKTERVSEDEDEDEDEDADAEAEAEGNGEDSMNLDAFAAAVAAFRRTHGRGPAVAELANEMDCEEGMAKKALKKLRAASETRSRQRAAAKIRGYHRLARESGYAHAKDASDTANAGLDPVRTLLSFSDVSRLTHAGPMTVGATTYESDEFKERLSLARVALPESAAREAQAHLDCVFRWAVKEALTRTMYERGNATIPPSLMVNVLKSYAENMTFSCLAPPGLVKFAKDKAPPRRRDYESTSAFKLAVANYERTVPFSDRGAGLVDVDASPEEKKLVKENRMATKKNVEQHAKFFAALEKAKEERKMAATQKAKEA